MRNEIMTIRVYVIITLVLGLLFIGVRAVEAESVLELTTSSEQVEVGEAFEVGVTMKQAGLGSLRIGGVEIPGSESFQMAGTSTSTSMQVVNGQSAALTTIVYTLVPTKEGSFTLGPVVMDGVESNMVMVEVVGKGKGKQTAPSVVGINNTKPPVNDEAPESGWWFLGILILVVVLGLGLIVKLASKKQSDISDENSGKGVSADVEREEPIEDDKVTDGGKRVGVNEEVLINTHEVRGEEYYVGVKENLIVYLEQKHGENLRQLSSGEVVAVLNSKDEEKINEVVAVLDACDQAIYAKKQVNNAELEKLVNKVIN